MVKTNVLLCRLYFNPKLYTQRTRSGLPHLIFYFVFSSSFWCPCMAINVSVQYNGGLFPDIILLPRYYYHRGTRFTTMKRFCICTL